MYNNQIIVDNLKNLLAVIGESKEHFTNAANNNSDAGIKAWFATYAIQRADFEMKIKSQIQQFGGEPDGVGAEVVLNELSQFWMSTMDSFNVLFTNSRYNSLLVIDSSLLMFYLKFLSEPIITSELREELVYQCNAIQESLTNVERLEKDLLETKNGR